MTNFLRGIAPAHRRSGLAMGLVQIHKPQDLYRVSMPTWRDVLDALTISFEQERTISHYVGGTFHGKRRTSSACARIMTFLHITTNTTTGGIPPLIAEARTRLIKYGHGAFLWTTCAHCEAKPDYIIAFGLLDVRFTPDIPGPEGHGDGSQRDPCVFVDKRIGTALRYVYWYWA